ncbi:MAG: kelch repeat-containing protein [Bacteroidota bacterium]
MSRPTSTFIFFFLASILNAQWQESAVFIGTARDDGVGFSIDGKGYAGSGREVGFGFTNDFFEYDPETNEWTEVASLPSVARQYCGRFSIADTAYVVCGVSPDSYLNELWAYQPNSDEWVQKAPFPGEPRSSPIAFAINGNAYVGTGRNATEYFGDMWEYDPQTNQWNRIDDFPGGDRFESLGMTIGGFAYAGIGRLEDRTFADDWWKFNPDNLEWTRMNDFPGDIRYYGIEGSNNKVGIIAGGQNAGDEFLNESYQYDPLKDSWTRLDNLPLDGIRGCFGFVVDNQFYLGTGLDENFDRRSEIYRIQLETSEDLEYQIYPNPFESIVKIFSSTHDLEAYCIYNLNGQELQKTKLVAPTSTIDIFVRGSNSEMLILEIEWTNGEITRDKILRTKFR